MTGKVLSLIAAIAGICLCVGVVGSIETGVLTLGRGVILGLFGVLMVVPFAIEVEK